MMGYPRQHELAVALREIGRVERTLFITDWLLDADMQCRAQIGLKRGESSHAPKNALASAVRAKPAIGPARASISGSRA